ncbi:unnamed protein product, partial [Rotaria socialis]
ISRGGLLKQLHQNDKIALLDEADSCLKRNGLIPDGSISEHNNIYEIVLTLYAGSATLTVLANTTEEPILRLLKKELSGDALNPFAERSLFLFITTPLTLEQPFPPTWDFGRQPTINQVAFTASQLNNLDLYYETSARLMTIAYGNLMCKLMIKNERNDKWITVRLGKSREHLHQIAVNLQLVQLTFDLIDQYKDTFGDLNHGLDDMIFQQRMKFIADNFLGRPNDQTRIRLELRLSIANSAVRLLNLLLRQYLRVFGEDNISLNTNDFQATEMNDSTTSFACSISVLQQSSQLNSTTAPALHSADTPLETGVSNDIPGQKQPVTSQASSSSTGIVTQFRLPRPLDLAATRTKQAAINRSRDIAKRST